jgi:hypothetical protein
MLSSHPISLDFQVTAFEYAHFHIKVLYVFLVFPSKLHVQPVMICMTCINHEAMMN